MSLSSFAETSGYGLFTSKGPPLAFGLWKVKDIKPWEFAQRLRPRTREVVGDHFNRGPLSSTRPSTKAKPPCKGWPFCQSEKF